MPPIHIPDECLGNRVPARRRLEEVRLSPGDLKAFRKAFREMTRPVYVKWAEEIGIDLVRDAERIVESAK